MQFRNGNLIRQPEYLAKSLNPILVDNAIRGNPGQEISNIYMDCVAQWKISHLWQDDFLHGSEAGHSLHVHLPDTRVLDGDNREPPESWDKIASVQ